MCLARLARRCACVPRSDRKSSPSESFSANVGLGGLSSTRRTAIRFCPLNVASPMLRRSSGRAQEM
eukprot:6425997-Lingulodinium_polyedra.AAC.1